MPNHIYTHATITGPAEALDAIAAIAGADKDRSVLEHYLPLPAEATTERTYTKPDGTTTTTSVFTDNGYTTALALWGSKWADYEVEVADDGRTDAEPYLELRFQSAWSPVVEGYRKLSTLLGITAVLAYEDECGNYLGASAVTGGEVVFERYVDGGDTLAEVPAEPEDTSSDEWYAWNDARNDAWNQALNEATDAAFAALEVHAD